MSEVKYTQADLDAAWGIVKRVWPSEYDDDTEGAQINRTWGGRKAEEFATIIASHREKPVTVTVDDTKARMVEALERAHNTIDILVEALERAHNTIDILLAKLIEADHDFRPTKSEIWPDMVLISDLLAEIKGGK